MSVRSSVRRLVCVAASVVAVGSGGVGGGVARADFISDRSPDIAPAYVSTEALKLSQIKNNPLFESKRFVGPMTLVRDDTAPRFIGNAASGGFAGYATFNLTTTLSFDDGLTWLSARSEPLALDFEFTPAVSLVPDQLAFDAVAKTKQPKVIILLTDGAENIHLRQSATIPSTGKLYTSVQGPYQISSFFDVFVELSLDGGQIWDPADAPLRLTAVPEPTALSLLLPALVLTRRPRR